MLFCFSEQVFLVRARTRLGRIHSWGADWRFRSGLGRCGSRWHRRGSGRCWCWRWRWRLCRCRVRVEIQQDLLRCVYARTHRVSASRRSCGVAGAEVKHRRTLSLNHEKELSKRNTSSPSSGQVHSWDAVSQCNTLTTGISVGLPPEPGARK